MKTQTQPLKPEESIKISEGYKFHHLDQVVHVYYFSWCGWGYATPQLACHDGFKSQADAINSAITDIEAYILEYYDSIAHYVSSTGYQKILNEMDREAAERQAVIDRYSDVEIPF